MRTKERARRMYFSGVSPAEIKTQLNIDKHVMEKWSIDWMAEIESRKYNATKQRIDYIGGVEDELFREIRKNNRDEKYIDNLTHNYSTYLV